MEKDLADKLRYVCNKVIEQYGEGYLKIEDQTVTKSPGAKGSFRVDIITFDDGREINRGRLNLIGEKIHYHGLEPFYEKFIRNQLKIL